MENTVSELKGRTILVTGAARRIGRAIALRLYAEGARVLIHYGTSEEEARQTAAECGGAPLFRANLESVDAIREMFAEVEQEHGATVKRLERGNIPPLFSP